MGGRIPFQMMKLLTESQSRRFLFQVSWLSCSEAFTFFWFDPTTICTPGSHSSLVLLIAMLSFLYSTKSLSLIRLLAFRGLFQIFFSSFPTTIGKHVSSFLLGWLSMKRTRSSQMTRLLTHSSFPSVKSL